MKLITIIMFMEEFFYGDKLSFVHAFETAASFLSPYGKKTAFLRAQLFAILGGVFEIEKELHGRVDFGWLYSFETLQSYIHYIRENMEEADNPEKISLMLKDLENKMHEFASFVYKKLSLAERLGIQRIM